MYILGVYVHVCTRYEITIIKAVTGIAVHRQHQWWCQWQWQWWWQWQWQQWCQWQWQWHMTDKLGLHKPIGMYAKWAKKCKTYKTQAILQIPFNGICNLKIFFICSMQERQRVNSTAESRKYIYTTTEILWLFLIGCWCINIDHFDPVNTGFGLTTTTTTTVTTTTTTVLQNSKHFLESLPIPHLHSSTPPPSFLIFNDWNTMLSKYVSPTSRVHLQKDECGLVSQNISR